MIHPLIARTTLPITVYSPAELSALRGTGVARVRLHGDHSAQEITDALDPDHLVDLDLTRNGSVTDLDFLGDFPKVKTILVRYCPALRSIDAISRLPLRELRLWELPALPHLTALLGAPALHTLILGGGLPWDGGPAADLPVAADLMDLRLPPSASLVGLERWPRLNWLSLAERLTPLSPAEWEALGRMPDLTTLHIEPEALPPADSRVPPLTGIKVSSLQFVEGEPDLTPVVQLFPALEELAVRDTERLDISPFAALHTLRRLHVFRVTALEGLDRLPAHVHVTRLPRPRSAGG